MSDSTETVGVRLRPTGNPLAVVTDPDTYLALAYLVVSFPLGIVYFTLLVTLCVVGFALLPLVAGAPILLVTLVIAAYLAEAQARLAATLVGVSVEFDRPVPAGETFVDIGRGIATGSRYYFALLVCFLTFPFGVFAFVFAVAGGATSLTLISAPYLYDSPGISYSLPWYAIDSLPVAMGVSLAGLAILVAWLYLSVVVARVGAAVLGGLLESAQNR